MLRDITIERRGLVSWIEAETLSDNSQVYNLVVRSGKKTVRFDCQDYQHASELFTCIEHSIDISVS